MEADNSAWQGQIIGHFVRLNFAPLAHMRSASIVQNDWRVFNSQGVVYWAAIGQRAGHVRVVREKRSAWLECFHSKGIFCVHQQKGELGTVEGFAQERVQNRTEKHVMDETQEDIVKAVRFTLRKPVLCTEKKIVDDPGRQALEDILARIPMNCTEEQIVDAPSPQCQQEIVKVVQIIDETVKNVSAPLWQEDIVQVNADTPQERLTERCFSANQGENRQNGRADHVHARFPAARVKRIVVQIVGTPASQIQEPSVEVLQFIPQGQIVDMPLPS